MISWRLVQSENAENPILVTLSGIVIFVSLVQPMKASLSIVVTVSGIVYSVTSLPAGKHISLFLSLSNHTPSSEEKLVLSEDTLMLLRFEQ